MENRLNKNITQVKLSGIRKFSEYAKSVRPDAIFLTIGDPDFDTPEVIKQKAIESLNNNETHYAPGNGMTTLRQAIVDYENKFYNTDYQLNECYISTGCTGALAATFLTICNEGDEIIVPSPFYTLYRPIIEMSHGTVVNIDTSRTSFQFTREMLEAAITENTKAILLTSPNNPTGAVYSQETLEMVHDVLKDKEIFVIVDEVYNRVVYKPCPSFVQFQDMRDRIIILQSFSKPFAMTGWRIGYIIADAPVAKYLSNMNQFLVTGITTFVQQAAIVALKTDTQYMVEAYQRRRDYAYARVIEMGLECVKPEGAFYMFPSIKKFGLSSEEFCNRALLDYGVACVAGVHFEGEGFIRISYCTSDAEIKEGLDRLEKFVKSLG